MDLQGKVCLITGGNSGIGASTSIRLAHKGARVVTVSRRGDAQTPESFRNGELNGNAIRSLKADIAEPEACRSCVERVIHEFGRIDVLVHSAGGPAPGGLDSVTEESWMNAFAVHVHAVFHLAQAAAPHMAKQGEGAIILLGSAAGLRGCLGALAYGVVKGALPQFARSLARELADQNIRVNCVSPGVIRTPFQAHLTPEQVSENIDKRIPLHREGQPEEVARVIESLIENDFITGENIVIDGGMTMRVV
jgi:NAD(P)-dependent dehydrogenase (short-subunit alcohol dehydrogenase family)